MKFLVQVHVKRHLISHQTMTHRCNFEGCKTEFSTKALLCEHKRLKHRKQRKQSIKRQIKVQAETFYDAHQCKCNATFKNRKGLSQHYKNQDPPNYLNISKLFSLERPYQCSQCDLRFTQNHVKKTHEKSHETFKYKCKMKNCGQTYWKQEILKEHQKRKHQGSHLKKKVIKNTKSVLKNLRANKKDKNPKNVTKKLRANNIRKNKKKLAQIRHNCSKCDSSFSQRGNLTTHMRIKHNIASSFCMNVADFFSPLRRYQCGQCDLRFKCNQRRSRHEKCHPNFEHKCEIENCEKTYWKIEILRHHQELSHNVSNKGIKNQDIENNLNLNKESQLIALNDENKENQNDAGNSNKNVEKESDTDNDKENLPELINNESQKGIETKNVEDDQNHERSEEPAELGCIVCLKYYRTQEELLRHQLDENQ
jgi:hypothetical protein